MTRWNVCKTEGGDIGFFLNDEEESTICVAGNHPRVADAIARMLKHDGVEVVVEPGTLA